MFESDDKEKFIYNGTVAVVIGFLSDYSQWSDGLHDVASIEWDGILELHPDPNYVSAILQLKNAINNWNTYSEELKSTPLSESKKEDYLISLGHMEISARC